MTTNANTALVPASPLSFPFKLEDLKSWTIKRTDGTVTKFVLTTTPLEAPSNKGPAKAETNTHYTNRSYYNGLSDYCKHTPGNEPIVTFHRDSPLHDVSFWIGNMGGARATEDAFNFVVDCGDILNRFHKTGTLSCDHELEEALDQFVTKPPATRVLKIDWDDRQAPPVLPQFWEELNKLLYGDVMTCCVGGHGRSGTAFVCLLLANAPDYDALDAIVHCRAVHCPRAIESKLQHDYIDEVAKYFKREANASLASKITDYKAAFKASIKPTAIRTRLELKW